MFRHIINYTHNNINMSHNKYRLILKKSINNCKFTAFLASDLQWHYVIVMTQHRLLRNQRILRNRLGNYHRRHHNQRHQRLYIELYTEVV